MRVTPAAVIALLVPVPLAAQWSVGMSVGISRYYGGAVSVIDSAPGQVHPYRPTTFTLTVGHDWGRLRADLGLSYAAPGLAAEIPEGAFVDTKGAESLSGAPEVTVRVLSVGGRGVLRAGGGVDFTVWRLTGFDTRLLAGGHLTAVYEWPIAGPFLGSIQAGLALSPSLFRADEIDASFRRRMMVRPGMSIGLRYR